MYCNVHIKGDNRFKELVNIKGRNSVKYAQNVITVRILTNSQQYDNVNFVDVFLVGH